MKILQLNIWGGRLEQKAAELIKAENPDFICLQESISIPNGDRSFFYTVEQIQQSNLMHLSFAPTFSFKFMQHNAKFGNAILSKQAVISSATLFTRGSFIADFEITKDDYNVRNLLHSTYIINGQPLHVLTHHGHHISSHKDGDQETLTQCKIIANYVSNLEGRVILTGDFNLSPHSDSLEVLNRFLRNACIESNIATTRTLLTNKTEVCDYIFTSRDIKVKNFTVSNKLVSDHAALIMEIE